MKTTAQNTLPGVPRDLAEHLESAAAMTPPAGVPRDLAEHEGRESFARSLSGVPTDLGYTGGPEADDVRESAGERSDTARQDDDSSTHQYVSNTAQ